MAAIEAPADFPFPFKPYSIQTDFMRSLYSTLEEGKVGLFESPTGTVSINLNGILEIGLRKNSALKQLVLVVSNRSLYYRSASYQFIKCVLFSLAYFVETPICQN